MAGLFDIFSSANAQDAANAQIAGINTGVGRSTNALDQGNQALTANFNAALKPLQTNYGQAQGGVQQLLAALGIGGPGGAAGGQAITDLLRSTPGYEFQLNQGNENVLRNAGRTGTLASGQTLNALQTQGQGQADQTYQQFIQNLQPFLGASGSAASGIANVNMGLGTGLNTNANTLAQLGYRSSTDIGNANANATLANNNASGNMWNAIMQGGKLAAEVAPLFLSDERAKTDKEQIGELFDGTSIYRFKYDPAIDPTGKTHVGVMAQDVEKTNPSAVKEFAGVKFVDYGKATDASAMFNAFLKAA